MNRYGDWMQTASGKAFWPLDPREDEIDIDDIAHALAMQCRYAGHCKRFYSVAQHSVLVAQSMPTKALARSALLHDATEAYLVDVPRPVKRFLTEYKAIEEKLYAFIARRFGVPEIIPDEVTEADNRILHDELQQLMRPPPISWSLPGEPLGVKIERMNPNDSYIEFLRMAGKLGVK